MNRQREENVGALDAYIRVSGGLILLALATFGKFGRVVSWTMFAAGASSVASGISRYCPITEALERSSTSAGNEDDAPVVARDLPWERESEFRASHGNRSTDRAADLSQRRERPVRAEPTRPFDQEQMRQRGHDVAGEGRPTDRAKPALTRRL